MVEEILANLGGSEAALLVGLAGFFFAAVIIGLLVYVYFAFALMTLAKRTKTELAWLAWIPIANIYLITQIAKKEWWWTLVIVFANIVPFIGSLISMAAMVYMYYFIAQRRKFPEWSCILAIIPLVNLVYLGFLAWGK